MKKSTRKKPSQPKGTRARSRPARAASSAPQAVRRQMEETRQDLADRLGAVRERVLGIIGIQAEGGTNTMAAKKTTKGSTKAASSAGKKSATGAKKRATAKKAGKTGGARKSATRSALRGVERKAKQVLGEALKGAAAGAVRGAVAAVVPSAKGKKSKKQEEPDE